MIVLHGKSGRDLRRVLPSILPLAKQHVLGWQIAMWTACWQGCLEYIEGTHNNFQNAYKYFYAFSNLDIFKPQIRLECFPINK
jgi:hypothetical protein